MKDKTLTCRDCNREFTFTATEQEDFAQKGFTSEPGRCPECRAARKAERAEGSHTSGGFSSGGRTTGGYSGGGHTSAGYSGGYSGARRETFPAVCARCGKDTQVPFQPHADRPVFCSDCYSAQRQSGGSARRSGGGGRGRSS